MEKIKKKLLSELCEKENKAMIRLKTPPKIIIVSYFSYVYGLKVMFTWS